MEAKEQGERIVEKYIETSHEKSFAMFKYLANMFMLMNGVAAISLLNKDPKMFKYAIIAFSTGCLISSILYIGAYCAMSDVFYSNNNLNNIHNATMLHKIFQYCAIFAFIACILAFFVGVLFVFHS